MLGKCGQGKHFGEDVRCLSSGAVGKCDLPGFGVFVNEVVLYVNMFCACMEFWISR